MTRRSAKYQALASPATAGSVVADATVANIAASWQKIVSALSATIVVLALSNVVVLRVKDASSNSTLRRTRGQCFPTAFASAMNVEESSIRTNVPHAHVG